MPELPEVQATVDYLNNHVVNQTISGAKVLWHKTVATHSARIFSSQISGLRIESITRRGKWIWLVLDSQNSSNLHLFIHLRMSGSITIVRSSLPLSKHVRVALNLKNNFSIIFQDTRKFGRWYLTKKPSVITSKLGIEPLDSQLSSIEFNKTITKNRTRIKQVLLNQRIIVGIGNIYADEALWLSGIHPCIVASSLTRDQTDKLLKSIRSVLRKAIKLSGTDFGDNVVDGGAYQPKAYGRTGKPCCRCHSPIERLIVAQRGTHICPNCQATP